MAIRTNTLTDGSVVVELDSDDDWNWFASENSDALSDRYGSIANAYQHATQGGLMLGGGAAPMVSVYFAE